MSGKKRIYITALLLLFSLLSCSRPDRRLIGVAVPNRDAGFFQLISETVSLQAEKERVDVVVAAAENNGMLQVKQVQDLISEGIDALIYIPAESVSSVVPLHLCLERGIPVVCIDRKPEALMADVYIGSDSVLSSYKLGKWILDKAGAIGEYAIIHGQMGTTPEIERTRGWEMAMADMPDMRLVAEAAADWDEDEAYRKTLNLLADNPGLSIIFAQCDTMALGAARAIRESRLDHKVWCLGFDGDRSALNMIQQGIFDATCTQKTVEMAHLAYEYCKDLLDGKSVPSEVLFEAEITTADAAGRFIQSHP